MAPNDTMINKKRIGKNMQDGAPSRVYGRSCFIDGLKETTEISVKIADLRAEIEHRTSRLRTNRPRSSVTVNQRDCGIRGKFCHLVV